MARIRSIKPEFWTSEQIMEVSPVARLAFIGIWTFCDDGGNHPAAIKTLKAEVFPGDNMTNMVEIVEELISAGLLVQYSANGKDYWHVTGWHHQKIDQPTFRHPKPDGTIPEGAPKRQQKAREEAKKLSEDSAIPIQSDTDVTAEHPRGCASVSPPESRGEERSKPKEPAAAAIPISVDPPPAAAFLPSASKPKTRVQEIAVLLIALESDRGKAVKVTPGDTKLRSWAVGMVTDDQLQEAHRLAVADRAREKSDFPINCAFLDIFVGRILSPPKPGFETVVSRKPTVCCVCDGPAGLQLSGKWYCTLHDQHSPPPKPAVSLVVQAA